MKTAASSRTRRATLLGVLAAGSLVLSACAVTNPQTTLLRYTPGDGIDMDGTDLDARDVLVVSHGAGAPGVVSGTLVNSGSEPLTVTVMVAGAEAGEVTVEPGASARLDGVAADGTEGERTKVEAIESAAGQSVEVRLQGGGETLAANVPVLLPQGPYADFADDAGGTVEPPQAEEGEGDH